MVRQVVASLCGLLICAQVVAGVTQFPYEAVVRTDQATVRCGQGKNYYATMQLRKGATVVVHRHDPGGWSMISPPEGSFSWISADHVRVDAPGTGTVELPEDDISGAPVWIGSDQGEEHSVRQRILRSGDTVQILDEGTFDDGRGSRKFYKISPPAREFRWVKGDFLLPADPTLRQAALNDPYSNPLETQATLVADAEEPDAPELKTPTPALNVAQREVRAAADSASPKAALREIDRHYTEMMELDPTQWDIDELVQSYQGLAATAPELAPQIQQRVTALEPRRKLHAEYKSLLQLSAETTARDQELAAQANMSEIETAMDVNLGSPGELDVPVQVASLGDPILSDTVSPTPATPTLATPQTSEAPKLNGAGIVRRLTNGQYGITSPTGKLLAILQAAPSIGLDRVVGQSMGFIGERRFDPQLGTDRLTVQQMVPVQLGR